MKFISFFGEKSDFSIELCTNKGKNDFQIVIHTVVIVVFNTALRKN